MLRRGEAITPLSREETKVARPPRAVRLLTMRIHAHECPLECGEVSPLSKLATGRVRPSGGRGHVRAVQVSTTNLL